MAPGLYNFTEKERMDCTHPQEKNLFKPAREGRAPGKTRCGGPRNGMLSDISDDKEYEKSK